VAGGYQANVAVQGMLRVREHDAPATFLLGRAGTDGMPSRPHAFAAPGAGHSLRLPWTLRGYEVSEPTEERSPLNVVVATPASGPVNVWVLLSVPLPLAPWKRPVPPVTT
jgi:hypothetical protein